MPAYFGDATRLALTDGRCRVDISFDVNEDVDPKHVRLGDGHAQHIGIARAALRALCLGTNCGEVDDLKGYR